MSATTSQSKDSRLVEKIADAVLYEGYILYPYRPSAIKNQQRWNFGVVCPESYARAQSGTESSTMRTECLIEADASTTIDVKVRFLHLMLREVAQVISDPDLSGLPIEECEHSCFDDVHHVRFVPWLKVNERLVQPWQEAVEREVVIGQINVWVAKTKRIAFEFLGSQMTEQLKDESARTVGQIVRTQQPLIGEIEVSFTNRQSRQVGIGNRQLFQLSVTVRNLAVLEDTSVSRDDALMQSFISTHTILDTRNGAFVSLLDPPEQKKQYAAECQNTGTYPVLVGEEGDHDCVLSSPIILYDYPRIAPQSTGNLFDGTEIDEILTLRIMSLTDDEKSEMRSADELARKLLERTESLSAEQMMNLHGVMTRKS